MFNNVYVESKTWQRSPLLRENTLQMHTGQMDISLMIGRQNQKKRLQTHSRTRAQQSGKS